MKNDIQLPKSSTFVSPQCIFPKVLVFIRCFIANMRLLLCCFWSAVILALGLFHGCYFLLNLFLFIESQTLSLNKATEICSAFNFLLDSGRMLDISWSIFTQPKTAGKFLQSQSLKNGIVTLCRLIHVRDFFLSCVFNFFRSLNDLLLFEIY